MNDVAEIARRLEQIEADLAAEHDMEEIRRKLTEARADLVESAIENVYDSTVGGGNRALRAIVLHRCRIGRDVHITIGEVETTRRP